MKKHFTIIIIFTLLIFNCVSPAYVSTDVKTDYKINNTNVVFASTNTAIDILSAEDDYIKGFSKFDWAAKYNSARPLNLSERKAYNKLHVLNWDDWEKDILIESLEFIKTRLIDLNIPLPDQLFFIKTDSLVENGAPHTRANAIVFRDSFFKNRDKFSIRKTLVHELFHVISRANINLRPELYAIISYHECKELKFPSEISDLKLTNPDAHENNYFITANFKGTDYTFIPILFSTTEYIIDSGNSMFMNLRDDMLAINLQNGNPKPIYQNGKLLIVSKDDLIDYYDKIGFNTSYTFHPEETLADNFVYLILGSAARSPWVIEELKKVFLSIEN